MRPPEVARRVVDLRKSGCLVKTNRPMSPIGDALARLEENMLLDSGQLSPGFSDLNLPVSTVRKRMHGSAGAHRGVASVPEAFQTSEIRRVKMGVSLAGQTTSDARYVIWPFGSSCRVTGDRSLALAMSRCLELVAESSTVRLPRDAAVGWHAVSKKRASPPSVGHGRAFGQSGFRRYRLIPS